jgi:hypothetical protein
METKKFYLTSEFWIAVAAVIGSLSGALPIPHEYEGVVAGIVAAAYAISRGLAKAGVNPGEAEIDESEFDVEAELEQLKSDEA